MVLRHFHLASIVGLLLGSSTPARAASPEQQRMVVVEATTGGALSADRQERMRKEIADVITRNGLLLVPTETLPDRLQHCEIPGCLAQVAAASGAMLVLAVDAHFAKESFKLTVALWNADEGKLLGKDTRDCPICDEQDLWGTAALITQGLIERTVRPAPGPRLAAVAATTPPAGASATTPAQGGDGNSGSLAVYTGLGLVVAGLATLAVGTYYISVDGKSACTSCDRVRDTRKYGLPTAIVGGVATVGGAGLLTWAFWPRQAQVSIGPMSVQLAGRFQ
jgi:hypothetical protein